MRVRRCAVLFLEPREEIAFDLGELLGGGDGLCRDRRWVALAPHVGEMIQVDAVERELLGELSPSQWIEPPALDAMQARALERLLAAGLVIGDTPCHAEWRARDEVQRATHWHPLAATMHAFTRWDDVDSVQDMEHTGTAAATGMRQLLGAPPEEAVSHADPAQRLPLPRVADTAFDALLARRVTCRNFDPSRALPFAVFAQLLQRVFAAHGQVRAADDTVFLKKNVPSGGSLHPIDCYLVVQHVEGVAPGLYHYHAVEHALEPLPAPQTPAVPPDWMQAVMAGQHWFADAHVLAILCPRFDRTFWKYRQHAKGYRVVAMEAGHLSQTLYLAATEAGLGAFVTAAINEVQLEHALGLDPVRQGVLAVCGFGWRGPSMDTAELDPQQRVWARAPT